MGDDDQNKGHGHNPLAEQLSKLDLDVSEKASEPPPQEPAGSQESAQPQEPTAPQEPKPNDIQETLSDEALFQRAVDDLDPARIYRAKFEGDPGASLPDEPSPTPESIPPDPPASEQSEEQTRQQTQQLRDAALFEKMVGSVQPLQDRDKYKRPPRKKRRIASDDDPSPSPAPLITPSLPRKGDGLHYVPPLTATQRALLDRHRRFADSHPVPDLNVRGDDRRTALARLESFVDQHWQGKLRFVRIIHGRGLRSEIEPVLKPAVLSWLEGPGRHLVRGYVPERVSSGDYGSLIVELSISDVP